MIAAMRRWLLLLMVLMLPLRGWVGEAMAGQMLRQHAVATVAAPAPQAHEHQAHAHHAAGGHDHAAHDCDHEGTAKAAQPHGGCPTCASCQICSAVALSPPLATGEPEPFTQPRPQTVQLAYASAEPGHFFKPPRH